MKTQISNLRSGKKSQLLNSEVDYSTLPKATSHVGHSGTNNIICTDIWQQVVLENKEEMTIDFKGIEIVLKAKYSVSGKSVNYTGRLTEDELSKIGLIPSKHGVPNICISFSNDIVLSNGHKSHVNVCPSLITIK